MGGDYALQLLLSTKGDIYYINEIMSVYRKNYGSVSSKIKTFYWELKFIETLSYFNYYSDFKFDVYIKKRIDDIRGQMINIILTKKSIVSCVKQKIRNIK